MITYGLDLSSRKIAMFCIDERRTTTQYVAETIEVKKLQSRAEELYQMEHQLRVVLQECDPGWVYIEDPVVGRGGARPTILQAQVDSLIQVAAVRFAHLGCYSVNNKTWKKAIVGNGNANKEQVAAWLATTHPVLSRVVDGDQDLVDAACVALYGKSVVERAQQLA